jgi:hypothetical protein
MPTPLLDRLLPHSITEFRAAAFERFADAEALLQQDHRTAAVYLYGYAAEMVLKARWFTAFGYDPGQRIALADVRAAINLSPSIGFTWPVPISAHDIGAWGQSLFRLRARLPSRAYTDPAVGTALLAFSAQVYRSWRETLRYHKNVAYAHEVRSVRRAVAWLVDQYHAL